MMHANRELRQQKHKAAHPSSKIQNNTDKHTIPTHPHYGSPAAAETLRFKEVPKGNNACQSQQQMLVNIRHFLAHFQWELAERSTAGCTWMEFAIAYEAHGYHIDTPVRERTMDTRFFPALSAKAVLILFRKCVIFVTENCLDEVDARYFDASRAPAQRLHSFAILQGMPGIRALPVIDQAVARIIATGILAGKGAHITEKQHTLHKQGNLILSTKVMGQRASPTWRRPQHPELLHTCDGAGNRSGCPPPNFHTAPHTVDCPRCNQRRIIRRLPSEIKPDGHTSHAETAR